MFERVGNFDAAFPKTGNEIDLKADELCCIGILRHVKALRPAVMMQNKFFRRKADCGSIRPVGHHGRYGFDGIFEQGKTARTRPAINTQTPGLLNQ